MIKRLFSTSLLLANAIGFFAVSQTLAPDSVVTEMLERGDSLLQSGKPVGALGMFRSAESRTFDPCLYAQALAGVARVQSYSDNKDLAAAAWTLAENSCTSCPRTSRTPLVLGIADGWIICDEDEKASRILNKEWERLEAHDRLAEDETENLAQLAGALARVNFLRGEWILAEEWARIALAQSDALNRPSEPSWNVLEMQAHILATGNLPSDLEQRFLAAISVLEPNAQRALARQVHTLLASERLTSDALRWAERLRNMAGEEDMSNVALAELRLARSAHAAHIPLKAIIAYHEAEQAAALSNDPALQAEVFRQSAAFHVGRNDVVHAWTAMQAVDSLNRAMLAALPRPPSGHESTFSQHILAPDPFDRAAAEILASSQPIQAPGPWMWISGLLLIGILAYGFRTRELTRLLQRERGRLVRLRSFVPADRLMPTEVPPSASAGEALGQMSLRPNGELWHDRDDETGTAEVRSFLRKLDREMACEMEWTVPPGMELQVKPQARIMVRNLLQSCSTVHASDQAIKVELGRSEKDWTIHLTCENTALSRALSGLFQGKDAAASTRWNELNQQLRLLTAEIVVERLAPGTERLSVTLPS